MCVELGLDSYCWLVIVVVGWLIVFVLWVLCLVWIYLILCVDGKLG